MTQVKIRTADRKWAATHGVAVEEDADAVLVTVNARDPEHLVFAGCNMIRFDLGHRIPADYPNRWAMCPATFIVPKGK